MKMYQTADHKTYKSALLEFYQQQGIPFSQNSFQCTMNGPQSSVTRFECLLQMPAVRHMREQSVVGRGKSKREAEHAAAGEGLRLLANAGYIPTQGLFMRGLAEPESATPSRPGNWDFPDRLSPGPHSLHRDARKDEGFSSWHTKPVEHRGGATVGGSTYGQSSQGPRSANTGTERTTLGYVSTAATQEELERLELSEKLQPDSPTSSRTVSTGLGSVGFQEKIRSIGDLSEAKELLRTAHKKMAEQERIIFDLYEERKHTSEKLNRARENLRFALENVGDAAESFSPELDQLRQNIRR